MGSGASTPAHLSSIRQVTPEHHEKVKRELSRVLTREYSKLTTEFSGVELELQFENTLRTNERALRKEVIDSASHHFRNISSKNPKLLPSVSETGGDGVQHLLNADDNAFRGICSSTIEAIKNKAGFVFLVAVDGSNMSEQAFFSTLNILKKGDHVSIFHVSDRAKENDQERILISQYKSENIRSKLTAHLTATLLPKNFSMVFREKEGEETVKDVLLDYLANKAVSEVLPQLTGAGGDPGDEINNATPPPAPHFFVCSHTGVCMYQLIDNKVI